MYQIYKDPALNKICAINEKTPNGMMSIPIDPANTDYANFKKEVLAGAELQDADGNVMTQADAFIATLP
jgi:uncharacterized protein YjbI with pentapeptide repeats